MYMLHFGHIFTELLAFNELLTCHFSTLTKSSFLARILLGIHVFIALVISGIYPRPHVSLEISLGQTAVQGTGVPIQDGS